MQIDLSKIKDNLSWWIHNIPRAGQKIREDKYSVEIYTDSSKTGWGAYCGGKETHGFWSDRESREHINFLELLAVYYGLKCFANQGFNSSNILLRVDNITAIFYINHMGSIRNRALNSITQRIWKWCEVRDIFIHASYISTSRNLADKGSRVISTGTEWELCDSAFMLIRSNFGTPTIDLFASHINRKCPRYISLNLDPYSYAVDAFTVSWKDEYFYAFPPFSMILRTIKKIISENALGILVVPYWPSQPWYSLFNKLLTEDPVFLGPDDNLLSSPFRESFPIGRLILVAGRLSGLRLD